MGFGKTASRPQSYPKAFVTTCTAGNLTFMTPPFTTCVDRKTRSTVASGAARFLRISVMTDATFSCPYCLPKEQFHEHYSMLKSQERCSFEEIVRLAPGCSRAWACASCASRRQPLLRTTLADLVGDLTDVPGIDALR